MHKKLRVKRTLVCSLLLFSIVFSLVVPVPRVAGEVALSQINPSEGPVGSTVSVAGQISTENGSYKVFFDNQPVKNGSALLFDVADSITVPNSTSGVYSIELLDVISGESSSLNFTVTTRYEVKALAPTFPRQLQEGANVTVLAVVTGGDSATAANMTVRTSANSTHMSSVTVPVSQNGYGQVSKTYPIDFSGNPHTFYVGSYNLTLKAFNQTLATSNFTIGLTDFEEYHRFQTVQIQALNYTSSDRLKISVFQNDKTVFESAPRNASEPRGMIAANWTIPANASFGVYTVNVTAVTPLVKEKPVADTQIFSVVSKLFECEVNVVNLDGEPVEKIVVEANDTVTSTVSTSTTNKNGLASFTLEASTYAFSAILNNSNVGVTSEVDLTRNFTGISALSIASSLAHIKTLVEDEQGNPMPFVTVTANFTFTTRANTTIAQVVSAQTSVSGAATLRNLFVNVNYTVETSRYGHAFGSTILNLTSSTWFNVTTPTHLLAVTVDDRSHMPLQNVQVKVYEWSTGLNATGDSLSKQGTTDENGNINFNFTFGKYGVLVFVDGILTNKSSVNLVSDPTVFQVHCRTYPLTLNVTVLDYFGQGIVDANVTVEREGLFIASSNTGGSGVAQFKMLVGGNYKIFVRIGEKPVKITTLLFEEPETVMLKVGGITSIGGFTAETSHVATAVFTLLLILFFALSLFIRRRRRLLKNE